MRRLATVLVAGLVVLSGCSVLSGSGGTATPTDTTAAGETTTSGSMAGETTTSGSMNDDGGGEGATTTTAASDDSGDDGTPAPTPTPTPTPSPTPTPESDATPTESGDTTPSGDLKPVSAMSSLPAGVSEQKVTNMTALFSAQDAALTDTGKQFDITVRNSTGPNFNIRIANDTEQSFLRLEAVDRSLAQEYFIGQDEAGFINESTGRIGYGKGPTTLRRTAGFIVAIFGLYPRGFVKPVEWKTAGVYTTSGGEQRLVLKADGRNKSRQGGGFFAPSWTSGEETLISVSGRIEVTSEGVIRYGNVTGTIKRANGSTYTKGIEFTIGPAEPVKRPGWLDDVPHPSLSIEENNKLLVYEYPGNQPIEAGTNLSVKRIGGFGGGLIGNATLDQSVEKGETVYLYKTGEGRSAKIEASVGSRPSLPGDATAFTGKVSVSTRIGQNEIAVGLNLTSSS